MFFGVFGVFRVFRVYRVCGVCRVGCVNGTNLILAREVYHGFLCYPPLYHSPPPPRP